MNCVDGVSNQEGDTFAGGGGLRTELLWLTPDSNWSSDRNGSVMRFGSVQQPEATPTIITGLYSAVLHTLICLDRLFLGSVGS